MFVVVVVVVFVVYFGLFVRAEVKINTDRERSNEHLVTLYSLPLSLSHSLLHFLSLTLSYTSSLLLSHKPCFLFLAFSNSKMLSYVSLKH